MHNPQFFNVSGSGLKEFLQHPRVTAYLRHVAEAGEVWIRLVKSNHVVSKALVPESNSASKNANNKNASASSSGGNRSTQFYFQQKVMGVKNNSGQRPQAILGSGFSSSSSGSDDDFMPRF